MCIVYFLRHTKHNIEIQCTYLYLPVRCIQNLYDTLTLPGVLYPWHVLGYETPKNFKLYTTIICLSNNTRVYFMRIGQKISLECIYSCFYIFSSNDLTFRIWLYCSSTTFPHSPDQNWGNYRIIGRYFLFPPDICPKGMLSATLSPMLAPRDHH
jgi:hypothetical protein